MFFLILFFFPMMVYADTAHSSVVMDIESGRILYEKNPHQKRLIASTTKIMTAIIVLENSDIQKEITIGDEVLSMEGTNIYIKPGETLTIKDLLYGLLLRSGNDAAISLAIGTLGSEEEFVGKMNEKAKEIGMKNTTFQNPHGLDDKTKNYSTAYDMALLSRYAYQNKMYREIVGTKKYSASSPDKSYLWYNRMSLLSRYRYCIGGKNGYTPKAGKTLVTYAKKGNLLLTIVTLDDPNLYENHKRLYEKYFQEYQNYTIIDPNTFYVNSYFVKEELFIKDSFQYPLKESEIDKIKTLVELYPKKQNKIRGYIHIQYEKEKIGKIPIYEKKTKKEEVSFFQKLKNLFRR